MPTSPSRSIARARATVLGDVLVDADRLDDLPADGAHGVERRHRILVDHRDPRRRALRPSRARTASSGRGRRAAPSRRRCAPAAAAAASATSAVSDFPDPDSPTRPSFSRFATVKETSITGRDRAEESGELDREVPDVEHGGVCARVAHRRAGSSARWMLSPSTFSESTAITITRPGKIGYQYDV